MKYFTYDLEVAINKGDRPDKEQDLLERQWQQNADEYRKVFQTLKDRLPEDVHKRFSIWGLHDYRLVKMEVHHKSLIELKVCFTVSGGDGDLHQQEVWVLEFEKVSLYNYQHHNYDNEQSVYNRETDNWLYQEFLSVDQTTLSFEVIFSSGANVLLHFPDNAVSLKKIK